MSRVFNSRNEKNIRMSKWVAVCRWWRTKNQRLMSWHSEKPWLLSVIKQQHFTKSQGVSSSTLQVYYFFHRVVCHTWALQFYRKIIFLFAVIKRLKSWMVDVKMALALNEKLEISINYISIIKLRPKTRPIVK